MEASQAKRRKSVDPVAYNERRRRSAERARAKDLTRRFGITAPEYDAMFERQGGVCAICGMPEVMTKYGRIKRLAVDHCHRTGRVRGLLCGRCNTSLGLLGDDASRAEAVVAYLKSFSG